MLPHEGPSLREPRHMPLLTGAATRVRRHRRTCTAPGCETVLSTYNPSERCSMHRGWQDERERHHA